MGEIRWVTSGVGAVALDDRHYPVVLATWEGPASATTLGAFFDWNDDVLRRAIAEKRHFSLITDAARAARPDAAARAIIAERTQRMQRERAAADPYRIVGPVVLEDPLVRGALTAVGWIMGTSLETEYAASCEEAIALVRGRFAAKGAAWPASLDPARYVPARR